MSASETLPEGKHQSYPHRKRTIFTEKQLKDLILLFNKNPYPDPSLKREMASKMNLDPMVLQVWFKNHRAKLKKEKRNAQQNREGPQRPPDAEPAAKARPAWSSAGGALRTPGASPLAPIYTNRQTPSFRLSICPPFKIHTGYPGSHKMIHFGCCQDPTVYCLHPISEPPGCSARLRNRASPCRGAKQRVTLGHRCCARRTICEAL